MAPTKPREASIERTPEYDEFLATLAEYHEKRGTHLDAEPKVGTRHIDLLRLYKRVVEEGGYDKVSDTKGNKLAWRKIAAEFLPGSSNLTTQAFLVKSAYYKNLAAYEITTIHKREPPPKEILENVSAKGGDLLNRTVENYFRPASREAEKLKNGDDDSDDDEGDTSGTPKGDKMEVDDPGSTGRVTRALRHAPPQRVLFQPEMSTRQTRQATGHLNSPQPSTNGNYYGTSGAAMAIANYEPRPAVPSNMKPVSTPANNPEHFRQLRMKNIVNRRNKPQQPRGMMLPGTGFPGPNIYIRALHALRSKEPEEEAYALHHLVKISHERGEKYRFDGFAGLAEALIGKVIEVASIFYDVNFEVSYSEEEFGRPNILNGLEGTRDLIGRLKSLEKLEMQDSLLPQEVIKPLGMITEAGLVIRNMVQLRENAQYVAYIPSIRDLIVIVLNLPHHAAIVELQHYILEIAEQLTRFWTVDAQDPLYRSLLAQLDTGAEDRGRVITSLRALGRTSLELETTNKLTGVPTKILRSICDWLLAEDEELRNACLDFLYLFTGFVDNVETLTEEINLESLVVRLVCLLQYGAKTYEEKLPSAKPSRSSQYAESAPKLSAAIIAHLAALDEPERSSQWLRTCFEEDPTGEITQIQLWSAYNEAFKEILASHPEQKSIMQAKDFITNVSTTLPGASAQVITANGQPKYTIRGIRPRLVPVDPATKKAYLRCCWHPPSLLHGFADSKHSTTKIECGEFASGSKAMWEHILSAHLKIPRDENGKWLLEHNPDIKMENGDAAAAPTPSKYFCHWGGCTHFSPNGTESAYEAGQHIKTHLPDTSLMQAVHAKHNRTLSNSHTITSSSQVRAENFQPQFSQPVGLGSLGMYGRYPNNGYYGSGMDSRQQQQEPLPPHQPAPAFRYYNTAQDEAMEPIGLPLASVLVLRNLARQLGKLNPPATVHEVPDSPASQKRAREDSPEYRRSTGAKKPRLSDAAKEVQKDNEEIEKEEREDKTGGWVQRVFSPVKDELVWIAGHNLTMKNYMVSLLQAIAKGGA